VAPDPELDGIARLAGVLTGARAMLTLGAAPRGAIPLRGADGEVRGGLLVDATVDTRQQAALDELAAQAGALLEHRDRESGLLDAVGALLRTNDELTAFAGRVAHDLRAPLTAVLGFLALADGPLRDETAPRAAECVRSAHAAAVRMRGLIEDLLAFATLESGPRPQAVDLRSLLDAVTADLGTTAVSCTGSATVVADPTLLRQMVQNLVANALRHGEPPVAVRCGVADGGWWLEVADRGPGVPPADRDRIFDPLVRLTAAPGSGLGLATCAKIADALGATIAVHDTPGGGATFRVRRPG
jgi:signal transduction histidine kinase